MSQSGAGKPFGASPPEIGAGRAGELWRRAARPGMKETDDMAIVDLRSLRPAMGVARVAIECVKVACYWEANPHLTPMGACQRYGQAGPPPNRPMPATWRM